MNAKSFYYCEQPRVGKVHSVFAETRQQINIQRQNTVTIDVYPYISELWPFKVNCNTQVADILQKKKKMQLKGLLNGMKSFTLIIICCLYLDPGI